MEKADRDSRLRFAVAKKELKAAQAAKKLDVCERAIYRLLKKPDMRIGHHGPPPVQTQAEESALVTCAAEAADAATVRADTS